MKKKKKKSAKRRKYKISRRAKVVLTALAFAMLSCTFSVFYVVLGSYDGLGLPQNLQKNAYDMSALETKEGKRHYDDGIFESVNGIDVSSYQKEIDWEKVKSDGIEFAMIRLGYRGSESGRIVADSRFRENLRGARRAGLDTGVYFFSQAITVEEAVEEAKYVIRHIRGRGVNLPVAFDMEPVSGEEDRISGLSVREKTEIADAFCKIIEKNGYRAMVYGNPHWLYNHLERSYLSDYPVWLAHYAEETEYPYAYQMWQYTDRGRVDGIEGRVDLNLLFRRKE